MHCIILDQLLCELPIGHLERVRASALSCSGELKTQSPSLLLEFYGTASELIVQAQLSGGWVELGGSEPCLGFSGFPVHSLDNRQGFQSSQPSPPPRHNVDFDDNVENHVDDEDGVELIDEADDGLPVLEKYSWQDLRNTTVKYDKYSLQTQRNTVHRRREIQFAKDEKAGVELIDEPEDGLPVLEPGLPICPGPFHTSIHHTFHHLSKRKRASTKIRIRISGGLIYPVCTKVL